MIAWFVARVLPGLVTGAVMSVFTWLAHRKTRRHVTEVAAAQAGRVTQAVEATAPGPAVLAEARGARSAAEAVLAEIDTARKLAGNDTGGGKA